MSLGFERVIELLGWILMEYTGVLTWRSILTIYGHHAKYLYHISESSLNAYLSLYDIESRLQAFVGMCNSNNIKIKDENCIRFNIWNVSTNIEIISAEMLISYLVLNHELNEIICDNSLVRSSKHQFDNDQSVIEWVNKYKLNLLLNDKNEKDEIKFNFCNDYDSTIYYFKLYTNGISSDSKDNSLIKYVKECIFAESVIRIDKMLIIKCDVISMYDGYKKYILCVAKISDKLLIWKYLYDQTDSYFNVAYR